MIVADNLTSQISDIHSALPNIASSLKDGGFLLLHEVTMATTGSSLNSNTNNSNKISVASGGQQQANFLTEGEWKKAFDAVDLEVVAQKSDGILSSLFLCRKSTSLSGSPMQYISVDDRSLKWVEEIKELLIDEDESRSEEKIWLVADRDQFNGVVGFVNCLKQEPGGHRIR